MATTVNKEKIATLIDGTEIKLRPLKISLLKKFMKRFDDIQKVADDNEKSMTILMECVQIALQQYQPDLAGDLAALEDNIDLPTVYQIVEEASGARIADTVNLTNA